MTEMPKELKNSIIVGDCREVDLIYLDPPFFSSKGYDLIWGDKDSKATIEAFEDATLYKKVCGKCGRSWRVNAKTGKYYATCRDDCKGRLKDTESKRMNAPEVFTEWLKEAIQECYRVLKPTGVIYVHLDIHAVHYVKVMMDGIFGYGNFRNEIVWHYTKMNAASKNWVQNHDNILFYSKTDDWQFNVQYIDEDSALKQRLKRLIGRDNKIRWKAAKTVKQQLLDSYINSAKKRIGRELKDDDIIIDFEIKGKKKVDNIWYIPLLKGNSKERLGYDTQKPEALLERIIYASSNTNDLILDPFCGCGTAIAVAQRLDRKWIGIDIEPLSCTVMQTRMQNTFGIAVPLIDLEKTLTEDEAVAIIQQSHKMNPFEFQDWVVKVLGGKTNKTRSGDGGIDGWIDKPFDDLKKGDPIQVKMSAKVGDPAVRLFAFDTMNEGRDHSVIVAYSFSSTAENTAKEIREQHGINIWLMTVKDMLVMTSKKNVKAARKYTKGKQAKLLQ